MEESNGEGEEVNPEAVETKKRGRKKKMKKMESRPSGSKGANGEARYGANHGLRHPDMSD